MSEHHEMEGWSEYRKLVISELERLGRMIAVVDSKVDALNTSEISQLKVEVAMLKVRCAIIGAVFGTIPAIVMIFIHLSKR